MTSMRINFFIGVLVVILTFLQYHLWFEKEGINNLFNSKSAIKAQIVVNDNLKKDNDDLIFQIQRLQQTREGTESRARQELGMIKKGETYYQIVK